MMKFKAVFSHVRHAIAGVIFRLQANLLAVQKITIHTFSGLQIGYDQKKGLPVV